MLGLAMPGPPAKTGSLRERKKARTRHDLMTVASRLFRKQGYERTTLEQIAEQAEVSIRTLPRYFETKRQLALAAYYEALAAFRGELLDPGRERPALECWREHSRMATTALMEIRGVGLHLKFVLSEPALATGLREVYHSYGDVLTAGLAQDAGVDPDTDLYSRLLAGMLVSGNWAAARRWVEAGRKEDITATCMAIIDFAADSFPARGSSGARRLERRL